MGSRGRDLYRDRARASALVVSAARAFFASRSLISTRIRYEADGMRSAFRILDSASWSSSSRRINAMCFAFFIAVTVGALLAFVKTERGDNA
jgi:hypothetical protein